MSFVKLEGIFDCDGVLPEHIYNMGETGSMLGRKGGCVWIYGAAKRPLQGQQVHGTLT